MRAQPRTRLILERPASADMSTGATQRPLEAIRTPQPSANPGGYFHARFHRCKEGGAPMTRLTDLELAIEDIPERAAADAWKRLNMIAEAYISDGPHLTLAPTTYAPIDEDGDRAAAPAPRP